jgi:16S rRNA (uracil1498-N3)-methyltransferase
MPKFFVDEANVKSDRVIIAGDDVKHIKKVLRLNPGDRITVCDGKGNDYHANIEDMEPDRVIAGILDVRKSGTEPPIEVTLFQGIPKSDKMDLIIQKSVELGIIRIVPVSTERTVVRLDKKKDAANKVARWQRISLEAAKQCNRGVVPEVEHPVNFEDALRICRYAHLKIIPYEKEREYNLKKCLGEVSGESPKNIAVFVGPEGGFSEDEVKNAVNSGVMPITLGPRILRTETAGIAVLSILMYELGDIGNIADQLI